MTTDTPQKAAEQWTACTCGSGVAGHVCQDCLIAANAMARHILATVRADDDQPADAEWFADMEVSGRKKANSFMFDQGQLFIKAHRHEGVWSVRIERHLRSDFWYADNPTRGQVRFACLSMCQTLQEVPS